MGIKRFLTAFFLSSILLANIVLAQAQVSDILDTIMSLLVQYMGVIFIIIFVIILLLVGGVIKRPRGGISLGLIAFLVLIVLAFVLPQFITFPDYVKTVPENFKYWEFPEAAKDALQLIGLPREWGYVPAIIYLFVLPFAAIYTLVWAFLTTLAIFQQSNINRILALIVTFLTIPMGWFIQMVWTLFSFMGAWAVAIFAAVFIAGIFFRGAGIVSKEVGEYKKYVQMGKKGAVEIREKLKEAQKGTVPSMREAAREAHGAAIAFNWGAKVTQKLALAASPETPDTEVPRYLREAIEEINKMV